MRLLTGKVWRVCLALVVLTLLVPGAAVRADDGPIDGGASDGSATLTDVTQKTYLPITIAPFVTPANTFFGVSASSIEAQTFAGYPGLLDSNAMLRNKSMYWLEQTGVRYFRTYGSDARYFAWNHVNPANGTYDWSAWDTLVQGAQAHGVTVLASIGNGVPSWANGTDPGCTSCWRTKPLDLWTDPMETTAWYKYVRAFVERYDGDGINDMPGLSQPLKYYEFWNEPDLRQGWTGQPTPPAHQFDGSVQDYIRLSQVGYAAVKAADPQATVVGPATAQTAGNPDTVVNGQNWFLWTWVDWLNAGGANYTDIISFTRYPDQPNWDSIDYVAFFLMFADGNRAGKPVWLTETGWAGSSTDSNQTKASNFARFTFQAWNHNFVQRFFWYDWQEPQYGATQADGYPSPGVDSPAKALITTTDGDGAIGYEPDPYFHPTYRAVDVLVDVFSAFTPDDHPADISPNSNVRVYRFDKNGQTVWAAWIKATSGSENISLDTNGRTVRMISLFGDDLGTFSGGNLTLGPRPIYLTTDLDWNQNIGIITGRVHTTAHAWGNAAVGLTVQAVGPGGTYSAVTDADGNYVITGLPEGAFTVNVVGPSTTPGSRMVVVDRETRWGRTSFTIN